MDFIAHFPVEVWIGLISALLGTCSFGDKFDKFHRALEEFLIGQSSWFGVSGPYKYFCGFFLQMEREADPIRGGLDALSGFFQTHNFLLMFLWMGLISHLASKLFVPAETVGNEAFLFGPIVLLFLINAFWGFEYSSGMDLVDAFLQIVVSFASFTAVGYVTVFLFFVTLGLPVHLIGLVAKVVRLFPKGALTAYGLLLASLPFVSHFSRYLTDVFK